MFENYFIFPPSRRLLSTAVSELLHFSPHQRGFYPQLQIKLFAIFNSTTKHFGDNFIYLEFLIRHHENAGEVKKAIHFFTRAGAYNNVIRICKEHGLEDQLLNVALLSNPRKGAMHVPLQLKQIKSDFLGSSYCLNEN